MGLKEYVAAYVAFKAKLDGRTQAMKDVDMDEQVHLLRKSRVIDRPYIVATPVSRRIWQGMLIEPMPKDIETPEGLYYNDRWSHQTLEERFLVHGGKLT